MAVVSVLKNNFNGGEWDPALYDRTDLEKYPSAVKLMKNFIADLHGGATKRGGLRFIGEAKVSADDNTILVPFKFSVVQSYMLEFGDQYMRVYKDKSRVFEADKTITAITQNNPGQVTSAAHGFSNGDWVEINSVVGMTELNGRMFKVANQATNTFDLHDVDG